MNGHVSSVSEGQMGFEDLAPTTVLCPINVNMLCEFVIIMQPMKINGDCTHRAHYGIAMCNKCRICWIDGLQTVHIEDGTLFNDGAYSLHPILDGLVFVLESEYGGNDGLHVWVQYLIWLEVALLERTEIVTTVAAGILACPCDVTHDS